MDPAEIGRRVRSLRDERGLKQTYLARESRISRWELSRIENGHVTPTMVTLKGLADGLGVHLGDLLEGRRD